MPNAPENGAASEFIVIVAFSIQVRDVISRLCFPKDYSDEKWSERASRTETESGRLCSVFLEEGS